MNLDRIKIGRNWNHERRMQVRKEWVSFFRSKGHTRSVSIKLAKANTR